MTIISHHKAKGHYDSMRFALVNPEKRTVTEVTASDLNAAIAMAGLDPAVDLDHGMAVRGTRHAPFGFSYVMRDRAIFRDNAIADLWALGPQLCAGPGVVYAHVYIEDGRAEKFEEYASHALIDMPTKQEGVPLRFFASLAEIEAEIADKRIERPALREGTTITWTWPQPAPELVA
jgi:hypothetical protein